MGDGGAAHRGGHVFELAHGVASRQQPRPTQTEVQSPVRPDTPVLSSEHVGGAGAGRSRHGAQDTADRRLDQAAVGAQDLHDGAVRCEVRKHCTAGTP
jgi:hypothetical protein